MVPLALALILAVQEPSVEALYQRGLQQAESGELQQARQTFRQALRLDPANPALRLQLGQVANRLELWAEAAASFRKAIELAPDDPAGYINLALLEARLGETAEARQTLGRLLERDPDQPDALFLQARLAISQERFAEAERHLRRHLEARPDNPEALAELGVVLITRLQFPEGEQLLKRALQLDSSLGNARFNLGVAYLERGRAQEAAEQLGQAARMLETSEAYFRLGDALRRRGDLKEAEQALRKAVELDPRSAQAHYALSGVLRRAGKEKEARRHLEKHRGLQQAAADRQRTAQEISNLHAETLLHLQKGEAEQAEDKLNRILKEDPDNALAYYRLGQIAFLRRDYNKSLERAARAQELDPLEPSHVFLEAMCHDRLKRPGAAAEAYRRVLSLMDYAPAHAALARIALESGDTSKAVNHLEQAVALEPDNPDLRLSLANALEQAGRDSEAQKQRSKAQRLRKPDAS